MTTKISIEERRRLKKHASRNITYLLDRLGVHYSERGHLVQAACPCLDHGGDGDNDTAWSWRIDIGCWVCWSHACEERLGNDIFGLVRSVLGIGFQEATAWLYKAFGEKEIDIKEEIDDPENYRKEEVLHIHEPLDENRIRFLRPNPSYLINRGFDPAVLKKYEVGVWQRLGTYMHDHVVFPLRDHDGHLVGFTGRTLQDKQYFEDRRVKYIKWKHSRYYDRFPVTGDLLTSSILYNLYNAKNHLGETRELILVEGPLDGFKLEMAGIYNWVASLGTKFSSNQRTLLVKLGVNKLHVAYDNDSARGPRQEKPGEKGWERVKNKVGNLFALERVMLPLDRDVESLFIPEIKDIFKHVAT